MMYWVDSKYFNEEIREFVTEAYAENNHSYMPSNNKGALRWAEIKKQFITEDDNMAHRICSYCEAEGKPAIMGDFAGEMDTHGICPSHYAQQMKVIDAMRRVQSGFHDTDIPLSVVADEIIKDLQNAR